MRARESPVLNNLVRHSIMCQKNFTQLLQSRRYEGLVWFMQSMGFCSIYKLKTQNQYTRDFQMDLLMAAFSMVCSTLVAI
uniref:Uncharacterized protein n=1 Tax=Ditylenchus dipsaci TaxID=166011 RepID=A0A915D541_9BILA